MKRSRCFIGHHSNMLDERINEWLASEDVGTIHVHELKLITDRENKIVICAWVVYESNVYVPKDGDDR